jgi:tRNA pseudouridine13 synthase
MNDIRQINFLQGSKPFFVFNKGSRDFEVEEVPLYEFSGAGEHLIIKIRKKDMTTPEAVNALSSALGVKARDIGYAGLKDKDGSTIQSFSLMLKDDSILSTFSHEKIKILSTTRHINKLKPGHLKGNKFKLRLKKVMPQGASMIASLCKRISEEGMPNYFGYQRFGTFGDNHEAGKLIVEGKKKERNKELRRMLVSAYQSKLYNEWLSLRVAISSLASSFSGEELVKAANITVKEFGILEDLETEDFAGIDEQKQFFKLFAGDVLCHYPHGKLFDCEDPAVDGERFSQRQISVTGLLDGLKQKKSSGSAFKLESPFIREMDANGDRRFAWIFVEDIKTKYIEEEAQLELEFYLPRGSYATVLLSELGWQKP